MQRGKLMAENEMAAEHKMIPMEEFDVEDDVEDDSDVFIAGGSDKQQKISSSQDSMSNNSESSSASGASHGSDGPDLHTLGRLFLPNKWMSIPFDISVMLHLFVSSDRFFSDTRRFNPRIWLQIVFLS
jgi:hypothetical protein